MGWKLIRGWIFNDRFEFNCINKRAKIFKIMQRASSISNMKIEFNPREAIVGSSSIDRLPIRKSNSSKSIASHTSQQSQNESRTLVQSQQYSIDMLKRINQSLERQNVYLKKQLDFFTQACSSKRASLGGIGVGVGPAKRKDDSGYKDKIMGRIVGKDSGFVQKNDNTESTGLFNSKFSSGRKQDQIEQTISELYSKFNLKGQLPKAETVKEVTSSFLESIKQNYLKLKLIVDQIVGKKRDQLSRETMDGLGLLETVVLYWKNPRQGKAALVEKQKQSRQTAAMKQPRMEQLIHESLPANELTLIFQQLVKSGLKNTKFVSGLRSNLTFTRLVKRMSKNQ